MSSLSAFNGSKRLKISEYPVTEIEESIQGGYNQTKWVVEWLYSKAIELGFEITMYRAGTLGVPTTGTIWNQQENHLFRLIMGCVQMGAAPDWQFPIEVMPVDKVSDFIIQSSRATYPSIFNLHETSSFTWHALMLRLQTMFDINIVSHDKWVNEYLTEITKENLLFPLISFYQSGSNIKTDLKDAEFETARFDEAKIKYNLSNFNVTVEEFVKLIMQTNNEFEFV